MKLDEKHKRLIKKEKRLAARIQKIRDGGTVGRRLKG